MKKILLITLLLGVYVTLGVGALKISAAPPSYETQFVTPLTKGDVSVFKSESVGVKSSQSLETNIRNLLYPNL